MVDLHFHLLWGVDDGPQTRAATVAIARVAVDAGTSAVVATPHVGWDWPANNAGMLAERLEEVRETLRDEGIPLEVFSGAEVSLTRAVELDDTELHALRLGDGPWLLIEPPMLPGSPGLFAMFEMLRARGHRIIIAHPERCPAFHEDRSRLEGLVGDGMLCSITASALTGAFGRPVRKFARGLLSNGIVHNVASDAHDAERRPPSLLAELREAGLEAAQIEQLGRNSGRAIIEGASVPPPLYWASTDHGRLRRVLGSRRR